MDIQKLFLLGMKRDIPQLLEAPAGLAVNLGAGVSTIDGADNLDYPEWNADVDDLPYADNSVACVHAYHFLEHLREPLRMLNEISRVLKVGGVVNICVPHYSGSMAHHDLDHKHTFALDTWANSLSRVYYNKDKLAPQLKIHFNVLIAIAERNTCILAQLVKVEV